MERERDNAARDRPPPGDQGRHATPGKQRVPSAKKKDNRIKETGIDTAVDERPQQPDVSGHQHGTRPAKLDQHGNITNIGLLYRTAQLDKKIQTPCVKHAARRGKQVIRTQGG